MNLTAILAEMYRRTNSGAAPDGTVTTRFTSFVNVTHRELLGIPGMDELRDGQITFASVASQAVYGLPPSISRIEAITDRTTQLRLRQRSLDDIRSSDPGLVQTGPPDSWTPRGLQQVAIQPSAAAELFVKSASASDTAIIAYIEGVRTGGYPKALNVTLTGTTAVTFSAAFADFVEVNKFYLSTAAVGVVTLTQTSGAGAELARIQIGQTYARYLGIQLYPTPTSAITYFVDYVRTTPDMSIGSDEPLLPEDFHWLLVEGALLKEWVKRDDDRRVDAERSYTRGVSHLKYFVNCPADFLPVRSGRAPERSRFGAFYPPTRY